VLQALALLCLASTLWWAWTLYAVVRSMCDLPSLHEDSSPSPAVWPRVSLIVPARDEERDLEPSLRARLGDDYPNLQVVVINDRSADRTGEIAERLAQEDGRVVVLHISELPAGWLGKLHALHQGVAAATGEWLLFSDADVEFAPGTLRRAIARCEHDGRDHLAVIPHIRNNGILTGAAMNVLCRLLLTIGRPWRVADSESRAALGAGLFNLVRRTAYDRTPGLKWLRLEVADDIALGQMLKDHGARPLAMNAVKSVFLDYYCNLTEMARGLEKVGYGVIGGYSALRLLLCCGLALAAEVGFCAGFLQPAPLLRAAALFTALGAGLSQVVLARFLRRATLPALLFPLGMALMVLLVLRSGFYVWRRGGVDWRGTLYDVRELSRGSRLQIIRRPQSRPAKEREADAGPDSTPTPPG